MFIMMGMRKAGWGARIYWVIIKWFIFLVHALVMLQFSTGGCNRGFWVFRLCIGSPTQHSCWGAASTGCLQNSTRDRCRHMRIRSRKKF